MGALFLLGLLGCCALVAVALDLSGSPSAPPNPGTARLLVPVVRAFDATDRFELQAVLNGPDGDYLEYHVTAGCDTRATQILLMLSGDARIARPRVVGSESVTGALLHVSQPWFPVRQAVQIFTIPIRRLRCPRGVSRADFGTGVAIGGTVARSFETSGGSTYEAQFPQIGDDTHAAARIPPRGETVFPAANPRVAFNAGVLPVTDQINAAEPALGGSPPLNWSAIGYIRPSASWTDTIADHADQLWLLIVGAGIGILGSLMSAVAFELIRGKTPKTR